MKLSLFLLASVLFGGYAFADNSIKASVYIVDSKLKLYEVCGSYTGGASQIDITVDPSTRFEGHYVTNSNDMGAFCQIVRVVGNSINIVVPDAHDTVSISSATRKE